MAWVAQETFNTYSDGDLNTQNGGTGWAAAWTGSVNYDVQGTVVYEGAKAVQNTTGSSISRQLSSDVSGAGNIVYVAMRRSSTGSGASYFILQNTSAATRVNLKMDNAANVTGNGTTILAGYAQDTYYVFRITFNTTAGTYTVAYSTGAYGTGGTFSSESSSCTMSSTGDIRYVVLDYDVGGIGYWDYISGTSPFVTATSSPDLRLAFI